MTDAQTWLVVIFGAALSLFVLSMVFARLATPKDKRKPMRATVGFIGYWVRYVAPAAFVIAMLSYIVLRF